MEIEENRKKTMKAVHEAMKKKVYMYWGIPAGFFAGSFGS